MSDDPKRIVEHGYDAIAERYLAWSGDRPSPARQRALDLLLAALAPAGAEVLELGCGAGIPMTAALAEHHRVTGVDISARQIALATRNVPAATFQHADMAAIDFPGESFDAVVAFYALTHLPRSEQGPLLKRVARWLRPGGHFFATMGVHADPGTVEDDWLGAPMYFSHHDAATNRRLVKKAGLTVERAEIESEDEDGQPVAFLWVMARKPVPPGRI
ncbi:MAG: class I SAM-dependent methyltransferase [Chloroflexota bacterium]|nr:class I SAM-dependent methyltransferase [Chloroflexota bacterium]MDQ3691552.1 class I SAM-dependent methyltransferase [Chloroflexota bacterium]